MNHAKAAELAKMISETNDKIADINSWSKFKQGLIGNISNALLAGFEGQAGGAVVGVVLGSGLSVYDYMTGGNKSYRDDNVVKQNNYAKLALESDNDQASINTEHNIMTGDDWKDAGIGTAAGTGYSGVETVFTITAHNKELGKEAMNFNEKALTYLLNGDMAGANHAWWARDIALDAQKGLKDIPKDFWEGMWTGKTKAFKWNVSHKWFTLGGIGIGILSSIISNRVEGSDNEEENLLYETMIRDIQKKRKGNVGINIIASQI